MAATAELRIEEYARSLSMLRRLGHAAIDPQVTFEEKIDIEQLAFDDFETAIAEMLKTDNEFREKLDVDKTRLHPVIDGQVCAQDGTSMVSILENGVTYSQKEAQGKPALQSQVVRDQSDVDNAKAVNTLRPGMTRWGVSLEPRKELRQHPELYRDRLGYREGLSYIQSYSMVDDNTLAARSYSVDMSNEAVWREVLADYGMNIPEDASSNVWLDFSSEQELSSDEADMLIRAIRRDYYKRIDKDADQQSVNEYVDHNAATAHNYFNAYYVPLSQAVYSGQNSQVLQDFAGSMLAADIQQLKSDVRNELITMSVSEHFNDAWGKLVDSLVRYAVVEELRKGLPDFLRGIPAPDRSPTMHVGFVAMNQEAQLHRMHTQLASNIRAGVMASRSYGGCPGNTRFDAQMAEMFDGLQTKDLIQNPQEAFGGKSKEELSWHGGKVKQGTCVNCKKDTKVGVASWCKKCIKC